MTNANTDKKTKHLTFAALALALASCLSHADWDLNQEASQVNFLSTKNTHKTEIHSFNKISGGINNDAKATVSIDLASVNTNIGIRDERMQKFLFNTEKFATATLTAQLDKKLLAEATQGSKVLDVNAMLNLNGQSKPLTLKAKAIRLPNGNIEVHSLQPVLLNAKDFMLDAGIDKLKEIAKLKSISYLVPVTFNLQFTEK